MAISYDNTAGVVASGTGNLSWTHTGASLGVKGVVVQIVQDSSQTNDQITSVTYGSLTLTRVTGATVFHTAGAEDGAVYTYVGLSAIPQGAQTVNVTVSASGAVKDAHSYTFLATGDTRVIASNTADTANTNGTTASVSLVGSAGIGALAVGCLHSSVNAVSGIAAGAGTTETEEVDLGNQCGAFSMLTSITAGTITYGWTVTANTEAGIGAVALVDTAITSTPSTETATLTDTVWKASAGRSWTESATLSDTLFKAAAIFLIEAISLTDSLATEKLSLKSVELTETTTLSDTVQKGGGKVTSETVTLADTQRETKRWFYPDTLTLTAGAISSGALTDTWKDDGSYLVLTELQAPASPAFAYDFQFGLDESVPTTLLSLIFTGYYDGNAGHNVKLQQYRYSDTTWVNVTSATKDFPDAAAKATLVFSLIDNANYISGGKIQIRITHTSQGLNTHRLRIDELRLGYRVSDLTETGTLTDSSQKADSRALTETSALSDSIVLGRTASRTLSETLTASDDTLTLCDIELWETSTLADTVTKAGAKFTSETATLADSKTQATSRVLSEALTLTDPAVETSKGGAAKTQDLPDSANLSDSVQKAPARSLTETATLADTLSKQAALSKSLSETTTLADSVRKEPGRALSESLTLNDGRMVVTGLVIPEALTLSDSVQKVDSKPLTETITLSDQTVDAQKSGGVEKGPKELTDSATLTDSARKDTTRSVAEAATLTDSHLEGVGKFTSETATLSDSVTFARTAARTLSESAALTDALTKATGRSRVETATLSDSRTASVGVVLADSATLTDALTKALVRTLSEAVTATDTLATGVGLTLNLQETATLADTLTRSRTAARTLTEAATLTDSLTNGVAFGRVLSETVTLGDQFSSGGTWARTISETAVLTDTPNFVGGERTYSETATLADHVDAYVIHPIRLRLPGVNVRDGVYIFENIA